MKVRMVKTGETATVNNSYGLRLIEQGKLSAETPVREIWPEFARNGKENTLMRNGAERPNSRGHHADLYESGPFRRMAHMEWP